MVLVPVPVPVPVNPSGEESPILAGRPESAILVIMPTSHSVR